MIDLNYKNILLNQLIGTPEKFSFKETYPIFTEDPSIPCVLVLNENQELVWIKLANEPPLNIDLNVLDSSGRIKNTEIYYQTARVGIGREPLLNYKFDIAIPPNSLQTAFHVGDGIAGFSMGNGTSNGFIPEIIGMGYDENDAGLYFVGRSGNDISSNIPLVIIDGRNSKDSYLENRPIFGITSHNYNDYKLVIDQYGCVGIGKFPEIYKLEVEGTVSAKDIKIPSSLKIIKDVDYNIDGDLIYNIKPAKYSIDEKIHYGFIAEELNEVIPSLVGLKNEEPNDISYSGLIPLLVKTIQTQNTEIQELKQRISDIEKIL